MTSERFEETFDYNNPKFANKAHTNEWTVKFPYIYDMQICSTNSKNVIEGFFSESELKKLNLMDKP